MLRRCDGTDPHLVREDGKTPCDCGAVFDDVYWMVVYPHQEVHGQLTLMPRDKRFRVDRRQGPRFKSLDEAFTHLRRAKEGLTTLEDLVLEIRDWHDQAISSESLLGIKSHLVDEAQELEEAPSQEHQSEAEEAADVFMCLVAWIMRSGLGLDDFKAAVRAKLETNKARTWELQPDGSYRHKKVSQTP